MFPSHDPGGDVEGFAAVAFPIVRRVFGGLIANELVSVQPMSLPSGLIFFLDFTFTNTRLGNTAGESVYGGGVVGKNIINGVSLDGANAETSFYALNNGYASPITASASVSTTIIASGTLSGTDDNLEKLCRFDPDLSGSNVAVATIPLSELTANQFNEKDFVAITLNDLSNATQARRLSRLSGSSTDTVLLVAHSTTRTANQLSESLDDASEASFPIVDNFDPGGALGSVVGAAQWALENAADPVSVTYPNSIPEIDIKVDSTAVTAITKKLKAKGS